MADRSLEEILRTLTPEQLRYVGVRMYANSDAAAAKEMGLPTYTVYGWDNKQDVNEAVRLAQLDGTHVAIERMKRLLGKAVDALEEELATNSNRLDVVREVFDRVWGKPTQRNENENSGETIVKVIYDDD